MVEKHEQGEKFYIKIEMNIYYYCVSIHVYDVCMHVGQRLWRSEDNMFKSVLFFSTSWFRTCAQVAKLVQQGLLPTEL